MSWLAIGAIAAGAYAWKALGLFGLSRVRLRGPLEQLAAHLPAALFCGLVVQQGLGGGDAAVVLTRLAGLGVGGVAAWRKAPLLVVLVVAAATTAGLRLVVG